MNVDGIPAMSHQVFLGPGFLLGRADSHPDQQTLPFRLLVHFQSALSIQPTPHPEHRYATLTPIRTRLCVSNDEIGRNGNSGNNTGDAAGGDFGTKRVPHPREIVAVSGRLHVLPEELTGSSSISSAEALTSMSARSTPDTSNSSAGVERLP